MFNLWFAVVVFLVLFVLLLFGVIAGKRYAKWQMQRHSLAKPEVLAVVEGAVFALLGLLIAFTFTSADERFELRKSHIIEEANAVEGAYLQLDLLKTGPDFDLRQDFRQYVDTRLSAYKAIPDFKVVGEQLAKSLQLQDKIWHDILAATKLTNDPAVTQLIVQAVIKMFDVENTGFAITRIHPPVVVFTLLIGLAILSAFLGGYSAVENKVRHSIYIIIYVAVTAFIIYMIIDLELPRIGLIRVDSFDRFLIDVRERMI